MASAVPIPENDKIRFKSADEIPGRIEAQLKHRYGRGIYTHDIRETPSGEVIIQLGNTIPKDLSDSRERDNVLKFISIDNVYTLQAEKMENSYIIELPERDAVKKGFQERRKSIIDRLDLTMAKTIYDDVLHFGEVHNQLTPIRQILRWTRDRSPISIHRMDDNQRSDRTLDYINVLEDLNYLRVDEQGMAHAGDRLNSAELNEVDSDKFDEAMLGDVIQHGYHTLRERLDLRMLSHYPMISGAYYYDAIQREDSNLWLDLEAIQSNLYEQYKKRFKRLYIEDKLAQLSQVCILKKDGDYIQAEDTVYDTVREDLAGI